MKKKSFEIFSIGHGTKSIDEFISLLKKYEVQWVVDVRTIPRSRHNPQFNQEILPESLKKTGIGYIHIKGLGGLRHSKKDSVNTAWRKASFRGYADYMQTDEFKENLVKLIDIAKKKQIVLMCAESVPWRCHRSLIADALLVRGIHTEDIISATSRQIHTLTPFAKVRGTAITYPIEALGRIRKKPSDKSYRSQTDATISPEGG